MSQGLPCDLERPILDNKKTRRVEVRFSDSEYLKLAKIAGEAGLTVSDIVRNSATNAKIKSSFDSDLIKKLTIQIARAGGSINQIAKHCNTYKSSSDSVKILTELIEIKDILRVLRNANKS